VKASHTIQPVFDDPNLVSAAGLVPVLRLAEQAGFYDLLGQHLSVDAPNPAVKAAGVVGGMLAGADSIEGLDLLRHGGMTRLFHAVRAPSTFGEYLRAFTHGHVQQLARVNRDLLPGLTQQVPGLLAGGGQSGIVFLDVDDTVRQVHGYQKQGAGFGYSGVRGLNALIAAISTPLSAPVIAEGVLRAGKTSSARGGDRLVTRSVNLARSMGHDCQVMVRADSAFYRYTVVAAARRAKAWFSVTARMDPAVTKAIAAIDEGAWTAIKYPNAVRDHEEDRWVSDAQVAETPFTAFTSRRKGEHVSCRLVVRRVKRLQPKAGDGSIQGELFATYRYHAFVTNSSLSTVQADEKHRDHAIIEQVIAELKSGPIAHLPSGSYTANAAWLAHAVLAFNLARAAAHAAGMRRARWATLRTRVINVPARIAATGRKLVMHLPEQWPWQPAWNLLWHHATGPPSTSPA